ncbi:transglutaminase family protein [Bradyrhizobium sp. LHD-71]|uniref:transglutaminase family protein n=1 Tax=Bradyrhizobium sp. LHD-71 TaxID=3072141 RepID=UPI00280DA6FE|nr:transglutaminase family protein [Bradyrhizobium sp. LHD-71]MDQ8726609.1 transglutaminase family protein [Bradyrhizobium sp. LHD-71]
MRLKIFHVTTYAYDPPPSGVIQVLRLTPGNHDGQYVADWHVDVSVDARLHMQHDAFSNVTHVFSHGPLSELTVHVSGLVETQDTGGVLKGTIERFPPGFFLRATALTGACAEMADLSRRLLADAGGDTLDFLHALLAQLGARLTFDASAAADAGAASATEAFKHKRGGCQDHAHIFAACARAAGVPARFVSGHFYSADGKQSREGHAWAEAFVPQLGWVGFDPVNGVCTTDAHARVAVGLDYLGAAPVRGTYFGGGGETLSVAVKIDQAGRQSQN